MGWRGLGSRGPSGFQPGGQAAGLRGPPLLRLCPSSAANYAEHWCSLLKKTETPFGRCHSAVDPSEYYKVGGTRGTRTGTARRPILPGRCALCVGPSPTLGLESPPGSCRPSARVRAGVPRVGLPLAGWEPVRVCARACVSCFPRSLPASLSPRGAGTIRVTARTARTACAPPCPPTPAPAPPRASCCGGGGSKSAVSASPRGVSGVPRGGRGQPRCSVLAGRGPEPRPGVRGGRGSRAPPQGDCPRGPLGRGGAQGRPGGRGRGGRGPSLRPSRPPRASADKDVGSCPSSQIFLYNLTTCQPTCRSLSEADTHCLKGFAPVDGCGCPDHTFLDEKGRCVPLAKCSCYHRGLYLEAGEVVLRQGERW